MKIETLLSSERNFICFKIIIVICLFLCTFFIFKLFQNPAIYNATLKKVTHTYVRDAVKKTNVWKVNKPFYYRDSQNTLRWDGGNYFDIRENYYNNGDWEYAFFPLFPLVWKVLNIDITLIGLFNYLLFGFSVILFSIFFFKDVGMSLTDKFCVFIISLLLPTIVVFYMPYAEALFVFTFALAMWGLMKNKYRAFFVGIQLFAMTRPIFIIVGLAFTIIDILYFIKHKNFSYFIKELSLKLFPLLIGTLIVFFMFYLNSGSFLKYFEANYNNWKMAFSIPHKLTDWSIEAYGMNIFAIFFVLLPSSVILVNNFIKLLKSEKAKEIQSVFNGDKNFIREYFFNISIVYFWGVFAFVLFYQGGSLNGLHRYVFASPFLYIYLFCLYPKIKEIKLNNFIISIIFILIASLFMIVSVPKLEPQLNFNDSGFLTLFLDLIFIYSLRYIKDIVKILFLSVLSLYNIIWLVYLYNIYLCDGWIFT
ncbi:MAG: hypothetical protein WC223_07735 [Bacteroidales bacterium]|jgi:hypothetical protein